jgi:hypothetical protein
MKKIFQKHKVLISIASLLFLTVLHASCVSADLGDVINYKKLGDDTFIEAEKALNRSEYLNASVASKMALSYYIKANSEEGKTRVTELILRINTGLQKLCDYYYEQASKLFNGGKYKEAIDMARNAKQNCESIPDPAKSEECDKLITRANISINEADIERAKKVLEQAIVKLESKDYKNARMLAKEALNVFNRTGYATGILKCNGVLTRIDKETDGILKTAAMNYNKASEYYRNAKENKRFEDYLNAMKYAQEAVKGYASIDNTEGYAKSKEIIGLINKEISALEGTFKSKADNQYDEGRGLILIAGGELDKDKSLSYYKNATAQFTEAKSNYEVLYGWAIDTENTAKQKAYDALIKQCNAKLEEIQKAIGDKKTGDNAEQLLTDGADLLLAGDCIKASTLLSRARGMFEKVGDQYGIVKCDVVIGQINSCLSELKKADGLMKSASGYTNEAQYDKARIDLKKASGIYEEKRNTEGINKASLLAQRIENNSRIKKEAEALLVSAESDLKTKQFTEARSKANRVKELYGSINYSIGIPYVVSFSKEIDATETDANNEAEKNKIITLTAIVLAIILVVIAGKRREQKKERLEKQRLEAEKKALIEAENKKKEEAFLRDEERIKELELERAKLKAIIADEKERGV